METEVAKKKKKKATDFYEIYRKPRHCMQDLKCLTNMHI